MNGKTNKIERFQRNLDILSKLQSNFTKTGFRFIELKNIIYIFLIFNLIFVPGTCSGECYNATADELYVNNDTILCPGIYSNVRIIISSSNIVLDCNGSTLNGTNSDYGIYLENKNNVTIKNCNVTNNQVGIYLRNSLNNNITENNVSSNYIGIYLYNSSNNTLISNNVKGKDYSNSGILLSSSSNNTVINNAANDNNEYGIYLTHSSNNKITNNTANNNYWFGIYLSSSSNNKITNNTANNNDWHGIYLGGSSGNTIKNNNAKENRYFDIFVYASSDSDCDNIIENNTGSGNNSIKYFNSQVNLQNEILSELFLCNADSSNIDNVTIIGSDTLKNNGLFLAKTDNTSLRNINSSNNYYGIDLENSSNNRINNNTANNNSRGIHIRCYDSKFNNISNNKISGNDVGIEISACCCYGVICYCPPIGDNINADNTIQGNEILNNSIGIYSQNSNSTINSNVVCNNLELDFNSSDWLSSSGDNNICDKADGWNDDSGAGCRYGCDRSVNFCTCKNCSDCENKLNNASCTTVYLTANIINHAGTCITFPANNKTFDCQGHTIDGDENYGGGIGIKLNEKSNNTIKNCVITNFGYGIFLSYSSNNTITNNNANSNYNGIGLSSSSNNTITNNNANSNTGYRGYGIFLGQFSNNNTLINNTANSNSRAGIYLWYNSDNNKILNNKILNNKNNGIEISSCHYACGYPGGTCHWICKEDKGNSNNTIQGNEILNNSVGIYSQDSNSTINLNIVCNNTDLDFNSPDWLSSYGDNNTCNKPDGWNDTTAINSSCKYSCSQEQYLEIVKWTETPQITSCEKARYWVRIDNIGNNQAKNVTVVDYPGPGFKNGPAVNTTGDCTNVTSKESFDYGSNSTYTIVGYLNPGKYCMFMYESNTSPSMTDGVYNNTAMIYLAPEVNDSAYVSLLSCCYMDVKMNANASYARIGDNVGITINITNNYRGVELINVTVNVTLPEGFATTSPLFLNNLSIQPQTSLTLKINITVTSNASEGLNINNVVVKGLRRNLCNENEYLLNVASDFAPISILQCTKPYDNIYIDNDTTLCPEIYNNARIIINSSNIVLDCNNVTLNGNGSGNGIHLENKNNVTIKNCNVMNYEIGIYLNSSSNNALINNSANLNLKGFSLADNSNFNQIKDNEISNNDGSIIMYASSSNLISENHIHSNEGGLGWAELSFAEDESYTGRCTIYLDENSFNNNITDNNISHNTGGICSFVFENYYANIKTIIANNIFYLNNNFTIAMNAYWGCDIYDSDYSFNNISIVNNTIYSGIGGLGIFLQCVSSGIIANNSISNDLGIIMFNSFKSTIINNNVSNNDYGIYLYSSSNNTLQGNEISNNSFGIYSENSNSTINSNIVCNNIELDFNSSNWLSSSGSKNICDNPDGWNDTGKTGCSLTCQQYQCDLNNDGIVTKDWNDLIAAYRCFLGIETNCNNYYQNWNLIKQEYQCFIGNRN